MRVNPNFGFRASFFTLTLFFIGVWNHNIYCQSIIYKSDGKIIQASLVSKQGGTRSYQLFNDSTGMVYYINNKSIDSIRYEDGTLEKFFSKIMLPEVESIPEKLWKNSVGFNIWPLFSSNIEVFYERLFFNNDFGFKNSLLIGLTDKNPYGTYYNTINYSISSGVNYYFLQSDLFRFGTGAAFVFGQFYEEHYEYYNDNMDYNYYTIKKNRSGVFINASFTYKIQKFVFASIELDFPLFWDHPYNTSLLKTEIAVNF